MTAEEIVTERKAIARRAIELDKLEAKARSPKTMRQVITLRETLKDQEAKLRAAEHENTQAAQVLPVEPPPSYMPVFVSAAEGQITREQPVTVWARDLPQYAAPLPQPVPQPRADLAKPALPMGRVNETWRFPQVPSRPSPPLVVAPPPPPAPETSAPRDPWGRARVQLVPLDSSGQQFHGHKWGGPTDLMVDKLKRSRLIRQHEAKQKRSG